MRSGLLSNSIWTADFRSFQFTVPVALPSILEGAKATNICRHKDWKNNWRVCHIGRSRLDHSSIEVLHHKDGFHYNLPAGIAAKYEWNHTENLLLLEAEDYTQMILESDVLATSISLAGNLILSLSYPRMPCFHMLPCFALSGFFVVE